MSGDYGTLQNRIADEIARSDLTAQIREAIQSAIRLHESERFWFNEAEATAQSVAGQAAYAVPGDFLEPDALTLSVSGNRYPLSPRSYGWLRGAAINEAARGRPTDWAYYADQLWLYPAPDAAYTLTLSYLKRLPVLAASGDANAWMTHGEELIRARAKADLYANVIRDFDEAIAMKAVETEALANLRIKSAKKIASGRLAPTAF